jgi:hypothetical protein
VQAFDGTHENNQRAILGGQLFRDMGIDCSSENQLQLHQLLEQAVEFLQFFRVHAVVPECSFTFFHQKIEAFQLGDVMGCQILRKLKLAVNISHIHRTILQQNQNSQTILIRHDFQKSIDVQELLAGFRRSLANFFFFFYHIVVLIFLTLSIY